MGSFIFVVVFYMRLFDLLCFLLLEILATGAQNLQMVQNENDNNPQGARLFISFRPSCPLMNLDVRVE